MSNKTLCSVAQESDGYETLKRMMTKHFIEQEGLDLAKAVKKAESVANKHKHKLCFNCKRRA